MFWSLFKCICNYQCTNLALLLLNLFPIIFDATLNGMISWILFLVCSLLVFRNAVDFYMFILYSANLLKLFMSYKFFSGFFIIMIMSSANTSFLTQKPLISFSCIIFRVRTSSTVLNRSGKSVHPHLFPGTRFFLMLGFCH